MKSIIELIISLSILIGGSKVAITKAHDTFRDLALNKVKQGLSSTKALNDQLWK